ncbi:hypothetical protein ACFQL8_09140 [Streptomyces goshikiensis]|uniref:hypothetical protein n=1 Tax=Streptomyces goshikiensis TaxID=1942 RepID=UPI0016795FE4|nr:hypothetical protein [Streptomyces goshikiensis]GHD82254.1 hypothetical protein GCM10010336_69400 [Streptomyces goshikiensis]
MLREELEIPSRPTVAPTARCGSGTDPELMERLTRQVLDPASDEVMESSRAQQEHGDVE